MNVTYQTLAKLCQEYGAILLPDNGKMSQYVWCPKLKCVKKLAPQTK